MGSICSAIIVCRIFSLPDPREAGSQNPGATNVLRIAGKHYAAVVMIGDMLKGTIPVVLAKALGAGPVTVSFVVLAAVVGHMYPIFFGFKGGKGVATAIGALLGFHFLVGVMVAATWMIVANVTRYSSLASMVSITLAPLYTLFMAGNVDTFPPLFFMIFLVLFKHKENITRLMDGNEPKLKLKKTVMEEIIEAAPVPDYKERTPANEEMEAPVKVKKEKPAADAPVTKAKARKPATKKADTPKASEKNEKPKPVKPRTKKAPEKKE